MLYIHESPIHFGLIIAICIILLVMWFIGTIDSLRREDPGASEFSGILAVFFAFLAFLVLASSIFLFPAAATIDELLPFYIGAWAFIGLFGFFLVFYVMGFKWFKTRIWAIFLPFLGTLSYLALVWILPTPASTTIVSDGVVNYVAMPLTLIAYGGFLAIFYIVLVPLYGMYQVAKERTGSKKMWTWIGNLGLFLFFIALILMALVQFVAPYMIYIYVLTIFSWILILLGWYFSTR